MTSGHQNHFDGTATTGVLDAVAGNVLLCEQNDIRWAEAVMRLIPSAERVRFTSSGTEATLMAVRLARAFTGRPKPIRLNYNFHGWHDHMTAGPPKPFDRTATARGPGAGGRHRLPG